MRFGFPGLPVRRVEHDPALDVFDHGCWVLTLDGKEVGHVASTLSVFRSLRAPLTHHDWIWLLVVWADGRREMPIEDYPPWHDVTDLLAGRFTHWDGVTYEATRLGDADRERVWANLGITDGDF